MTDSHMENVKNRPSKEINANLVNDIQETRSKICNAFLITIAIIAFPALAASLYRINDIGWQPVMGIHIAIAITLWGVFFFRRRIPFQYQAGFIVLIFLIIGLGGMVQFGLVSAGTVFLVTASPIAILFFGGEIGIATMVLTFCGAVAIGLIAVTGHLKYGFDLATYAADPSTWISSIIGWGLASTALTVSLHLFNQNLINALHICRYRQESLLNQQQSLVETIEERNSANQELQKALEEIRTLRGILPICSYCHSIRDDEGAWSRIEDYLSAHSEAKLTHGICPQCMPKVRAGVSLEKKGKNT